MIYDEIGESWYGGTTAKDFAKAVQKLGAVKNLTVRINSVGGDVFEAQTMYNYLKSHKAKVTVHVDGLAASAASVVAMAGDEIIMPENALMMIHNPSTIAIGESEDLRKAADVLDKVKETLVNVYKAKTGKEASEIANLMDEETWLDATQAKELGFCDTVEEQLPVAACLGADNCILYGGAKITDEIRSTLPKGFLANLNVDSNPDSKSNPNSISNSHSDSISNSNSKEVVVMNLEELKAQYPELLKQIQDKAREEGVQAERERIKTLDSLDAPGGEAIVTKAKYEEPRDAKDIALDLLKAVTSKNALEARMKDAQAVNGALAPQKTTDTTQEQEDAMVDMVVSNIKKLRGGK